MVARVSAAVAMTSTDVKVERRRGRLVTARLGEQHRSHNHHHDGGPIHRP